MKFRVDKAEGILETGILLNNKDSANGGGKEGNQKAMVFHKMDTKKLVIVFVGTLFLKLCQEHKVKRGNKVVKKELIVALRGEIYFVKFIINPEEDDVEPVLIFGRSFLRLTKAITDFGAGTITIYSDIDPFLDDLEKTKKSMDDSTKEATKEALALRISQRFALLEEVRLVLETMAYNDKFEGQVNENALAATGSDTNIMPYRIYEKLGREEIKKVDRGIKMINYTQAEAMGILTNVLCQVGVTTLIAKFLILDIPIDRDAPIVVWCIDFPVKRAFSYKISCSIEDGAGLGEVVWVFSFDGIHVHHMNSGPLWTFHRTLSNGNTALLQRLNFTVPRQTEACHQNKVHQTERLTIGVTLLSITSGLHPLLDLDDFLSLLLN
ncbi:hypothetical protein Tco_1509634 [Tanacetum coccineum]